MPEISRFLSRVVLGCLVPFAAGTTAQAQSHYQGGHTISEMSPTCGDYGWGPVEGGLSRFRPAGVGSNSTDWHQVSFHQRTYAWHLRIPATAQAGEWVNARFFAIGSRHNDLSAIWVQLIDPPAGILWGNEIMLRMNLLNFEGIANCNITVNAVYRATP
ncbi:hypothetical protein [Pararhodobacter aggregans]|nr:hypothetical protein [Pararhodobacter aggregans]PTW99526.1 hypothetical protein C8N33_11431 [Pararhodobacter aggregans]